MTGTVSYIETSIQNTTTEVPSLPNDRRLALSIDSVVQVTEDRPLQEILEQEGLDPAEAERAALAFGRRADEAGMDAAPLVTPVTGSLVALRLTDTRPDARLVQVSVYGPDRYLATLAQTGPGRFILAADPWFDDNLLDRAGRALQARGTEGQVRLKDAIYTTALRNQIPSDLVGEIMVMLSRVQDLDQITGEDDRLRILYASRDAGSPAGRVLFVGLSGATTMACYVVARPGDDGLFECFDPDGRTPIGPNAGLGRGFLVPVAGTKTSGFGPRMHPVLKQVMNHNGVDWGAPSGTPVHATAPGTVTRMDLSQSFGNVVRLQHEGGVESLYAHLDRFAPGLGQGDRVDGGQLIGFVGTTGRSTGPHLHFEIWVDGAAVDPLSLGPAQGSAAVEALVNQIIRVESGGDARAKNTRSTATGLGQFIDGTWLRMMRTYRPDLVRSQTREQLLELRFDPALSREMVRNLARENEAFLRTRGHIVTPGKLYLAHFLGPQGADTALRAQPTANVLETMGAAVVNANPFLSGWSVQRMLDWSDDHMAKVSGDTVVAAAPREVPPEVQAYRTAVDRVLAGL